MESGNTKKEYCFDLMDNACARGQRCWFSHDIPQVHTKEYNEAVVRKEEYLRLKAIRKPPPT